MGIRATADIAHGVRFGVKVPGFHLGFWLIAFGRWLSGLGQCSRFRPGPSLGFCHDKFAFS
jgi:hypothetical protein